jgi:hypothetical protein
MPNSSAKRLNVTYQLLFHADDVNILGGSVYNVKENAEALVFASKENGLEANADKTKYILMSLDQDKEGSHNLNFNNSSFESVEEVRYLGTIIRNQNCIQGQIKNTFN